VINTLTFGDSSQHGPIKKRFGFDSDHTQFDMMELVDDKLYDDNGEGTKDFFYFVKLVRHIFVDEIHSEVYRSYSYSLNHNSKASQNSVLPVISMIYDFAPINMKITKQSRDLTRFLVNVTFVT
jgi:hypothetical protein